MSIAIDGFSSFAKVARDLENVSEEKTQISLGKIGGWSATIGRFDRGQAVRNELLKSLNTAFGVDIPESVLKAMNVNKAFSGFSKTADGSYKATNHPLTVRRLRAIVNAALEALDERANQMLDTRYPGVREQVAKCKLTLNPQDMLRVHKGLENYGKLCGKSLSADVQKKVENLSTRKQLLIKALVQDNDKFAKGKIIDYLSFVDAIDKFVTTHRRLPNRDECLAMQAELKKREEAVGVKYMTQAKAALETVRTEHLIAVAEGLKTYDVAEEKNCIFKQTKEKIQALTPKQQALIKAMIRTTVTVEYNPMIINKAVDDYLGKLNAIEEFVDRTGRLPDHVEVQGMRSESKK